MKSTIRQFFHNLKRVGGKQGMELNGREGPA